MENKNLPTSWVNQSPTVSSHSQALRSKTDPEQAQLIAQVFARFIAIYGHRWTSVYTTPELAKLAQSEWLAAIREYTVSEINRAIQAAIKSGNGFAPTLPEFVGMCEEQRQKDIQAERDAEAERRRLAYVPEPVDHEKVQRDKEEAQAALKRLLAKFGVGA